MYCGYYVLIENSKAAMGVNTYLQSFGFVSGKRPAALFSETRRFSV